MGDWEKTHSNLAQIDCLVNEIIAIREEKLNSCNSLIDLIKITKELMSLADDINKVYTNFTRDVVSIVPHSGTNAYKLELLSVPRHHVDIVMKSSANDFYALNDDVCRKYTNFLLNKDKLSSTLENQAGLFEIEKSILCGQITYAKQIIRILLTANIAARQSISQYSANYAELFAEVKSNRRDSHSNMFI